MAKAIEPPILVPEATDVVRNEAGAAPGAAIDLRRIVVAVLVAIVRAAMLTERGVSIARQPSASSGLPYRTSVACRSRVKQNVENPMIMNSSPTMARWSIVEDGSGSEKSWVK